MTWQPQGQRVHKPLLEVPEDGVVLSRHESGWLGQRMRALVTTSRKATLDRVSRGRMYAKGGRARDFLVLPGVVSAEVYGEAIYQPSVKITPLSPSAWKKIIVSLAEDLTTLAALIEGDLPPEFVDRMRDLGVNLIPRVKDVHGDCDCGDWENPCTHVACVLHLLADALDGDPFLLLTLRGMHPEDLLARLRAHWGDTTPVRAGQWALEEDVPSGDLFRAPGPLPTFHRISDEGSLQAAGLRALGPAPGHVDLLGTLAPLYVAGQQAALQVIDAIPSREVRPRRPRPRPVEEAPAPPETPAVQTPVSVAEAPVVSASDVPPSATEDYKPRTVVSVLAVDDGLTSTEIAHKLAWTVSRVRTELLALSELGQIYRSVEHESGRKVVRWWLG